MELENKFQDFLKEIRLTKNMRDDLMVGHKTLRDRLHKDKTLAPLIVDTFLQGSYRRSTAIRPIGDRRADVDIVVVTKIKRSEYSDPEKAMDIFVPFMDEFYKGKYSKQGRSFNIELSYVDMDLVIASAPSEEEEGIYKSFAVMSDETLEEAKDWRLNKSWRPDSLRTFAEKHFIEEAIRNEKEWQTQPLWIPDREVKRWRETHPLEQLKWTTNKNKSCNGHYVNIVKAIKWWEVVNHKEGSPKGYPLEHLVGNCCPDNIKTIAAGVTSVFESIITNYVTYAISKSKPQMPDRGLPTHDVFARLSGEEFEVFCNHAAIAAKIAREALDARTDSESSKKWRSLFGDKFPLVEADDNDREEKKGNIDIRAPFIINAKPAKPWSY